MNIRNRDNHPINEVGICGASNQQDNLSKIGTSVSELYEVMENVVYLRNKITGEKNPAECSPRPAYESLAHFMRDFPDEVHQMASVLRDYVTNITAELYGS